mmetsp:Transcript_18269/g.30636  ORF Transcript_18269/g.30636 Transcript_18269/m.30636 type:complete len:250 (+) Transcript_18269:70-819(+)
MASSSDRKSSSPPRSRGGTNSNAELDRSRSPPKMGSMTNTSGSTRFTSRSGGEKIRKNAKGGVLVSPEEIQLAFQMLDENKSGQVSLNNLKKRLGVLFPELTVKDYRFLMNNKKEMSLEDLYDLLLDNEITNFDPVAEAFKVFDPAGEGVISGDTLREAFVVYGMGELADEELEILIKTSDIDGDGVITLEDFRGMVDPVIAAARTPQSHQQPQLHLQQQQMSGKGGFAMPVNVSEEFLSGLGLQAPPT